MTSGAGVETGVDGAIDPPWRIITGLARDGRMGQCHLYHNRKGLNAADP